MEIDLIPAWKIIKTSRADLCNREKLNQSTVFFLLVKTNGNTFNFHRINNYEKKKKKKKERKKETNGITFINARFISR